jgi:nucleoside-diphosphate-sugar epimerase
MVLNSARHRVLVTGGSGFIGANLVDFLLNRNIPVLNLSPRPPLCDRHRDVYVEADVSDRDALSGALSRFAPTAVVHLAARTEARSNNRPEDYAINYRGAEALLDVLASPGSVRTVVFASTMVLAWPGGQSPTPYAQSKARMEQAVEDAMPKLRCAVCIVRPVSIWGPHFRSPFREFFDAVARARYWHPGAANIEKRFGYVGNTVYQLHRLLETDPAPVHGRRMFLGDYETLTIERWAGLIARSYHVRAPGTLPRTFAKWAAKAGDLIEAAGIARAPLTSRRLDNMQTGTAVFPIDEIRSIAGTLPYTVEDGVEETVRWLRSTQSSRRPS